MITQLNDFIFCPRSIFFAGIYRDNFSDDLYHQTPQREGLAHHETIDENKYSSRQDIITGLTVYSEKYHLLGRIDIFDRKNGVLTERKYSITAVYPGFRYQLYAQYFALTEMGYSVNIIEEKEQLFMFCRDYYRWFMKDLPISQFPEYKI